MPRTTFRPNVDGFAFGNAWTLDDVEKQKVQSMLRVAAVAAVTLVVGPVIGAAAYVLRLDRKLAKLVGGTLPQDVGLCGGMTMASLDYWLRGWIVQRGDAAAPTRGTAASTELRDFIWRRQIDSWEENAARMMGWIALAHLVPDQLGGGFDTLKSKSQAEFATLKERIDQGQPCPLMLISDKPDPFSNHQVLAYGYEDHSDGTGQIYVYDNNCENSENVISLDFRGPILEAPMSCQYTGMTLRGFFCTTYEAEQPPLAVGVESISRTQDDGADAPTMAYTVKNFGCGTAPDLTVTPDRAAGAPAPISLESGESRTVKLPAPQMRVAGTTAADVWCFLGVEDGAEIWKRLPMADEVARTPVER